MEGRVIIIRAQGQPDKRVGKWCRMPNGRRAFVTDSEPDWEHHNSESLPINEAVVEALEGLGVIDVYFRPKGQEVTYHTTLAVMRRFGFPTHPKGPRHKPFGPNVNLGVEYWERLPYRLKTDPWVPNDAVQVLEIPQPQPEEKPGQSPLW